MVDLIIVGTYLLVTLAYGLWRGRFVKNMKDYSIGSRTFTTPVIVATIAATVIGGSSTLGATAQYYMLGILFLLGPIGDCLQYLITAKWIVPLITRINQKRNMFSIGDIMHHFYGTRGKVIVGAAGFLFSVGVVGAQIGALGYVFQHFLNIEHNIGVLLGFGILLTYSTFGGFRSVVGTDVIQFAILIVVIPLVCTFAVQLTGGYTELLQKVPRDRLTFFPNEAAVLKYWPIFLAYLIPDFTPAVTQRFLISTNYRQLQNSLRASAFLIVIFGIVACLTGLSTLVLFPDIEPHTVFPTLVDKILPIGFKGLAVSGLLAVIMSTADSYLNTGAILAVHDVIKPTAQHFKKAINELTLTRIITIAMGIGAMLIALYFKTLFDMVRMSYNIWGPIVILPMLLGLTKRAPSKKAFGIASLVTIIFVLSWTLSSGISLDVFVPGILVNGLSLYIVQRFCSTK